MKHGLFTFISVLIFVSGTAFAQDTIKGKVVDKKGNPVVGTKITLKDGGFATTDFDGAFEIEASEKEKAVANCVGMQQKKVRMSDDMVIKLSKSNGWNRKPSEYSPFVMLQGGVIAGAKMMVGVMAGKVKNIGWYGKVLVSVDDIKGKTVADVNAVSDVRSGHDGYYWFDESRGSDYRGHRQLTAGGIVRLGCPLHFFMGAGAGSYSKLEILVPDINGIVHTVKTYEGFGYAVDGGFMLASKHFTMNLSFSEFFPIPIRDDNRPFPLFTIGFGYKF